MKKFSFDWLKPYINITLIIALITLTNQYFFYQYTHNTDTMERISSELSPHKYKVYYEALSIVNDVKNRITDVDSSISQDIIRMRISELEKDIIIYGSDMVITSFYDWKKSRLSKEPSDNQLKAYFRFILTLRRDMGYPDTSASIYELCYILTGHELE